jgi:murein DD-endopeptidase MepM/ murein hydrolase activator NlpD
MFWRAIQFSSRRAVLGIIILLLASGCSSIVMAGTSDPRASPTAYILMIDHNTPSATLTSRPISKTSLPPSPTIPSPTLVPLPSSTLTSTPTSKAIFRICSPLVPHSIQDLPKIVSDPYDPPKSWSSDERHQGVDFSYHHWKEAGSILGVGVQTVLAGRVAAALSDTFPYGNLVMVETPYEDLPPSLVEALKIAEGQSIYLLYGHLLSTPLASLGDDVSACQLIGAVGRSGNAEVAHLHLEARRGPPGGSFSSMSRFIEGATAEEKANYNLWRTSGVYRHFDPMILLLFELNNGG